MSMADLHIHSCYSDGTMTIPEILEEACRKNVSVLAVSDHDMTDGARELIKLSKENEKYHNITCIPAVEVNTLFQDENVHILGYYVDLEDLNFHRFVCSNREKLEDISTQLIAKMEKDYENISLSEFLSFTYDRTKGGFEALHYLNEKGFTTTLKDGFRFFDIYDCPYSCVDFATIPEAVDRIHGAGGVAVLAHPGVTIKTDDKEEFEKMLRIYADMGIDGIECYYPLHTEWMTRICLDICKEKNLFITVGSDCHGTYGNAEINQMQMPVSEIYLQKK